MYTSAMSCTSSDALRSSTGLEKTLLSSAGVSLTQDQVSATLRYAEERRKRRALAEPEDSQSDDA